MSQMHWSGSVEKTTIVQPDHPLVCTPTVSTWCRSVAVEPDEREAMPPKKKITAPAPEAEEQTPAEPVQEQATPTPVADESDVPSDQKHQAATEGKRGNASSPFDLVKSKKSKAKSPSKYKEGKKCYVSFSNDRNMPNAIYAEADAQDATRVEAIDMICPGEPDLYFVAIGDDNVVRVFHSWSALKNYYILDKVPFFTKLCDDKREL
eukprot:g20074.t1